METSGQERTVGAALITEGGKIDRLYDLCDECQIKFLEFIKRR